MPEREDLVRELFDRAFEQPSAERKSFVDRECGEDRELRDEVLTLIRALDGADEFLVSRETEADESPTAGEHPGTRLGRYELLEQLGEGGWGTVWRAVQTEGVRREVALKIIKLGMDTRNVVARFEAERQALALMSHANIAQVLDAGTTDAGRPYFVMELVRGLPITTACDHSHLRLDQRLRLFRKVCSAVQHAHQKGIVHRDIKPSNVLVTEVDGELEPKVIDFGIAKALHADLRGATLVTGGAQLLGTPSYMAPEQAAFGSDIDTRADVYSLGVLLYELVVGTRPFEFTAETPGYDEILRTIREDHPDRPSTRLRAIEDHATEIADARRMPIDSLQRAVRGDLDWITMRALQKEPAARYQSASQLGEDVGRYLGGLPVDAGPPSTWYRLRKLAMRQQRALVVIALGLMTLLGGMVGVLLALQRALDAEENAERLEAKASAEADHARDAERQARSSEALANEKAALAKQAEAEARREERLAREVMRFTQEVLTSTDIYNRRGPEYPLSALLDEMHASLHGSFTDRPRVAAEIGTGLGGAFRSLGRFEDAERELLGALELTEPLTGPKADTTHVRATIQYAWLLHDTARYEAAIACLEAERPRADGLADGSARAALLQLLGDLHGHRGDLVRADRLLHAALEQWDQVDDTAPHGRLSCLSMLVEIQRKRRAFGPARETIERALALHAANGMEPTMAHQMLLYRAAMIERDAGRLELARDMLLPVHARMKQLNRGRPVNAIGNCAHALGRIETEFDNREAAARHYREAWQIREQLLGAKHPQTLMARVDLGSMLARIRQYAEAVELLEPAVEPYGARHGTESLDFSGVLDDYGRALTKIGRFEDACAALERGTRIRQDHLGTTHRWTCLTRLKWLRALLGAKRFELAADQGTELCTAMSEQDGSFRLIAAGESLRALVLAGRSTDAVSLGTRQLATDDPIDPDAEVDVYANWHYWIGVALLRTKAPNEALDHLDIAAARRAGLRDIPARSEALEAYLVALVLAGQPDQADREWQERHEAIESNARTGSVAIHRMLRVRVRIDEALSKRSEGPEAEARLAASRAALEEFLNAARARQRSR